MTIAEIADKLESTEAAVAEALERKGMAVEDVNDSVLLSLGGEIHGGGLATTDAPDPVAMSLPAQKTGGKLAAKKAAAKIAKARPLESVEGQSIEAVDLAGSRMASEFESDATELAKLLTPELRTMMIVQKAQGLSGQLSASLNERGVTVESIVDAALPRAAKRKSIGEMMDTAISGIDVDAMIADVVG